MSWDLRNPGCRSRAGGAGAASLRYTAFRQVDTRRELRARRIRYDLLSGNLVFLRYERDGLHIHGLPEPVDAVLHSSELLGEAAETKADPRLAIPHALVILGRMDLRKPVLTAISSTLALIALTPNILLTDPVTSQAHLHALGEMCERFPCYTLDRVPSPAVSMPLLNVLVGGFSG